VGARVVVADLGVAVDLKHHPDLKEKKVVPGTRNMVKGPAMSRTEAIRSIETGIELVEEELRGGMDILGTGDMGIGNTTSSSAITAVLTGAEVSRVTGRGTGLDDEGWRRKTEVIQRALEINRPDPKDPIDVLSKVGGLEIGGIVGVILAELNTGSCCDRRLHLRCSGADCRRPFTSGQTLSHRSSSVG
jgi:nicotinate-nucleotide--dimethylbenzimidazole phosphoribosyltransferase